MLCQLGAMTFRCSVNLVPCFVNLVLEVHAAATGAVRTVTCLSCKGLWFEVFRNYRNWKWKFTVEV